MTDVFESPSEALLAGFGSIGLETPSAAPRLLLYSCYRQVYTITESCYHNTNHEGEMQARRRLIEVLKEMCRY
ncbi:hypothetical protein VTN49DRAFT_5384 [Thermomyces lanuginosus]|uniref:uncharacterized protein n=1 Tax=Thermomyces lanuginosus TaxID=5541 RepID=UPI0037429819